MKTHYFLVFILSILLAASCSEKVENPVNTESKLRIVLKDISPTEFTRGEFISIHGSDFGDSSKKGFALFGDVTTPITTYKSSYYLGVIAPFNAYDGDIRIVFGKDTSNSLPYKIKWKPDDYKLLLAKVTKVVIYAKFDNQTEDTLVYELNLNEKFTYETSNFKLSVDTTANAIKIKLPKQGLYYETWGGPPCDTSSKIIHTESWKLNSIPIKATNEYEFIAENKGIVGTAEIHEKGTKPYTHYNKTTCEPWSYVDPYSALKGSIKIIFKCKQK